MKPVSASTEKDALAEAIRTCRLLWPGREVSMDPTRQHQGTAGRELIMVPNEGPPRLLLPAGSRRAAATIASAVNSGVTIQGRLKRAVLATAARTGVLDRQAPRRLHIGEPPLGDERPPTIEDELLAITQERLSVTFALGTPRANRKPVLTALDGAGRARYFVKVGHNELTKVLVRGEAQRLDMVARTAPSAFVAPRCIELRRWNDLELLVIEALPSSLLQGWRNAGPSREALREVAGLNGIQDSPLGNSAFWLKLTALEGVPQGPERTQLAAALSRVAARRSGEVVRFGSWHGDWTPDNMGSHHKRLLLWDWERFESQVPWGFDAVHFHFQAARYAGGWPKARKALDTTAPVSLQGLDVGHEQVELTVALYLAVITARYLRDREVVGGDALNAVIPQMMALLDDRVR